MKLYTNPFIEILRSTASEKVLLVEGKRKITAGELLRSAVNLAKALHLKGIKKGDRTLVAVKPGVEFLVVMYANMMVGTLTAIVDPEMGQENYREKVTQLNPQCVFSDGRLILLQEHPLLRKWVQRFMPHVPYFTPVKGSKLFTTGNWLPIVRKHTRVRKLLNKVKGDFEFVPSEPHDDLLLTYTSGTLHQPKGVVHNCRSLWTSISMLSNLLKANQDAVIATHLPHFALLGITSGVQVHLWNPAWSAHRKLQFMQHNKITTLFGPPSDFIPLITHLQSENGQFPVTLRNIYLGSAPVFGTFLKNLIRVCGDAEITCLYGMTEHLMIAFQDGKTKALESSEGDLVGTLFDGVKIQLAEDGEIQVASEQLFTGYFGFEPLTGMHKTGDLGRIDKDGRLILTGRKKDMIIRGNFNIYPGLYEPTISRIQGINEAVMVGVYNDHKADEEIILVIEGEKGMNDEEIMQSLKDGPYSIDKDALPDKILFRTLPRSGRQRKINRNLLRRQLREEIA